MNRSALVVLALVALAVGGCGQLTQEQLLVQQQQIEAISTAARDNGLSLVLVGDIEVDGAFESRQTIKWSPVTGRLYALLMNNNAQVSLHKLLAGLRQEPTPPEPERP